MNRISEEVIEQIRNQTDIVDIIGNYIRLKKQGRNYIGLCPFHGEKTPSFTVSPDKQIFHCFGCGKGGNVFSFLMEHDNLPFGEAVRKIAEISHIDVVLPELETHHATNQNTSIQQKMIEMHHLTTKLYHYLLMETEEGLKALKYLTDRGLSEKMISTFQIGFSPPHRTTVKIFLEKRGLDLKIAVDAGILTKRQDGEIVDRFRDRIMFPITNDRGQQIGFSGRLFQQKEGPKYLNSPETAIFNKRLLLYHFSEARKSIRKKEEVLLLEGFMDVIAATSSGVDNGVASMGTSLTEEHIHLLKRVTNRAVLCYDGDNSGVEATYKSGLLLQKENKIEVAVLMLPDEKDPDEFIKIYGAEKFKTFYQHEQMTWTAFKLKYLQRKRNMKNESDQIAYINEALQEIATLHHGVEREIYLKQLALEFDLSLESLKQQIHPLLLFKKTAQQDKGMLSTNFASQTETAIEFKMPPQKFEAHTAAERYLMKAMIEDTEAFEQIHSLLGEETFYHDDYQALYTYLIGFYSEGNQANPTEFIDHLPQNELKNLVTSLEMMDMPKEQTITHYKDYIMSLKKFKLENKIKQKEQEQRLYLNKNDAKAIDQITREIILMRRNLKNGNY